MLNISNFIYLACQHLLMSVYKNHSLVQFQLHYMLVFHNHTTEKMNFCLIFIPKNYVLISFLVMFKSLSKKVCSYISHVVSSLHFAIRVVPGFSSCYHGRPSGLLGQLFIHRSVPCVLNPSCKI